MKRQPVNQVEKGWGGELWLANTDSYCGKILYFEKGKKCSWHFHLLKSETFFIFDGKLLVRYSFDDNIESCSEEILLPGECFDVPVGMRHQMLGLEDTTMFEFSTHHEDSDSYRLIKGD